MVTRLLKNLSAGTARTRGGRTGGSSRVPSCWHHIPLYTNSKNQPRAGERVTRYFVPISFLRKPDTAHSCTTFWFSWSLGEHLAKSGVWATEKVRAASRAMHEQGDPRSRSRLTGRLLSVPSYRFNGDAQARSSSDAFGNTKARALIWYQTSSRLGSSSTTSRSSHCVIPWSCTAHASTCTRSSSRRSSTSPEPRARLAQA